MTIDEFMSLRDGDRIDNPMSGTQGTVTGLLRRLRDGQPEGVWITWDNTSPDSARAFTKHTTAWMHWTKLPGPGGEGTFMDRSDLIGG